MYDAVMGENDAMSDAKQDNPKHGEGHLERLVVRLIGSAERVYGSVPHRELLAAGFKVLMLIAFEPDQRVAMHELSTWFGVSRQNVTGLVDGLEKRGLVERSSCNADRRVKWVALTPAGHAALQTIGPRHHHAVQTVLGRLSDAQITALNDALATIREGILAESPTLTPTFSVEAFVSRFAGCSD